jgi:ribosomal protein S18 acetylase RimI-like enzyme
VVAATVIRHATPDDAPLLSEIGRTSFFDAFAADPRNKPEDMQSYMLLAFGVAAIRQELGDPDVLYLIAEEDGAAVGYAKLKQRSRFECVTGERPLEVSRLYARAQYVGRGVGPALMQACLDEGRTRGHDVIWLGVWEFNFRAQKFYEKWGFRRVGEHVFQLGSDPQIDWVLQREI